MSTLPISTRLLLSYLLVAVLPLAGLAAFYLSSFETALRETVLSNISTIADKKAEQIDSYMTERLADTQQLSQRRLVGEAIAAFGQAFRAGGLNAPAYRAAERRLRAELENHTEASGYYDLLLMDATGNVVFSVAREADLGTNLRSGAYRETELARGFDLATRTLQTHLTHFAPYAPSELRPAAFLMAPVLEDGVPVGALALQVDISRLEPVAADRTGLGQSGETVLAQMDGDHAFYTAPLKHIPDAAYRHRVPFQQAALPIRLALSGAHDRGVVRDYAGIECVAAWRYLPALRWGMVVKIDADEALAPAAHLRRITYYALALFLLVSGMAAYFLGRSLSRPIRKLTQISDRIAAGDLAQRAPQDRSDELGRLATAFNHMADRIHEQQTTLELQVDKRTRELQISQARLVEAQRIAQVGSWELDLVSGELHWSDEIFRIFEMDPAVFGASYEAFLDAIHPADRDRVNQAYTDSLATRAPYEISHRLLMPDGRIKWVNERCETFYDDQGKLLRSTGTVQDITDRKQAEEALRLYASVFEHSGEGILISNSNNRILAVNPPFTRMTGYAIDDIRGEDPRIFSSGQTPAETYRDMWAELARTGYWQGEILDRRKDGSIYPKWMSVSVVRDHEGTLTHYVASFTDITERKAAEDRIARLAHHDTLTGLLNRFSLQDLLVQALATVRREQNALAVMFIDMDRFKTINDTLGHAAGDELLVEVAHRLRASVRESDIVARLGGDEFVVVLTDVENATAAARVADKVLHSLGQHYRIGENELHSTPSIGLAFYPDDGEDGETLMKNADTAMYHAKAQGRNNVQFFTASMNRAAMERLRLEHDLRVALEAGQFELHYQPQLNGHDGSTVGFEALVRWRHPHHGLISPAQFIPVAEETGLILPLGEWVLDEACRQLHAWRNDGLADASVAVNLSAHQLRSPDFLASVSQTLEKHGLTGADLELEITESVAMHNPEASIVQLKALRELGVRLSIDDFGTGYSSLSYLKLLPIHTLKLDQSFVRDIETDANDVAICAATIALAHNLGLTVVAEGVETEAQRDFLTAHRCDFLQGYLFSKPLPAADALAFIRKRA